MTAICVVDCRIVSIAVVIISEARVPPAGRSQLAAGQGRAAECKLTPWTPWTTATQSSYISVSTAPVL